MNTTMRDAGRRVRPWIIALLVVVAVALVAATWIVATVFQSPAQRQAAAEPPPAQPVVVEATKGDLVDRTTMMAEATLDDPRTVTVPLAEGTSVVTGVGVAAGQALNAGAVVIWTNDRPVFALRGPFPFFRDIGEGDSGEDVRMFQQALADIGYGIAPDGDFGAFTAQCVRDLYRGVGAAAPLRDPVAKAGDTASPTAAAAATATAATQATVAQPAGAASGTTQATAPKKQVFVPKSEVMILPALPAQVAAIPAVGTVLSGENSELRLSGTGVALSGKVPGSTAVKLNSSMTGTAQAGGQTIPVKIGSVKAGTEPTDGAAAGTQGSQGAQAAGDPSQSTVVFVPVDGVFPPEWAGNSQVLITLDLTPALTGALLVPQRAVAADASGTDTVLLKQDDGSFVQTQVQLKACVDGMCALAETDAVAVGSRLRVDR